MLYATAFILGFFTLGLEILGIGMIAPYFGTAHVIISNLIGIVLGSLAIGYYIGGRISYFDNQTIGKYLFSLTVAASALFGFQNIIATVFAALPISLVLKSFFASVVLFAPVNIYIGITTTLIMRAVSDKMETSGEQTGYTYALNMVGSVFGATVTGFLLIPYVPTEVIFGILLFGILMPIAYQYTRQIKKLLIPSILFLFLFITRDVYIYTASDRQVLSDGSIDIIRSELVKLDDAQSQYSRVQVYEGTDQKTGKPIRLLRVNRELHSGSFLDSNELVFNYAKFNTLAGHFNPKAQKALLLGGGAYSYPKFFLGDTPLFDSEKIWEFRGELYTNDKTVSQPVLLSNSGALRRTTPSIIYESNEYVMEGEKNRISASNQIPGSEIVVDEAHIHETGFSDHDGFVHVHEVNEDGSPGVVISPDISLDTPGLLIGHSERIAGDNEDVIIPLDRNTEDGEVVYVMLHRDNGNDRFDDIMVDGYSQIRELHVVEIDPQTTEFAEKYFDLNRDDPRLKIFHEDARTFINRADETYDIIYIDAFQSFYNVPFQLTTIEAIRGLYDMLNENGIIVVNTPTALTGPFGKFFQAEYRTYREVFPEVYAYAVDNPERDDLVQNVVMIAFKSKEMIRETPNLDEEINKRLLHRWDGEVDENAPILTDDYAPVEFFIDSFVNVPTL